MMMMTTTTETTSEATTTSDDDDHDDDIKHHDNDWVGTYSCLQYITIFNSINSIEGWAGVAGHYISDRMYGYHLANA